MRKPKTNWNALSEEEKTGFFEFWLATKFFVGQTGKVCYGWPGEAEWVDPISLPESECPGDYCKVKSCSDLCTVLFVNLPKNEFELFECPCIAYGKKAVAALEQCLIDDGWIPKQASGGTR